MITDVWFFFFWVCNSGYHKGVIFEKIWNNKQEDAELYCSGHDFLPFSFLGNVIPTRSLQNYVQFSHSFFYSIQGLNDFALVHIQKLLLKTTLFIKNAYVLMSILKLISKLLFQSTSEHFYVPIYWFKTIIFINNFVCVWITSPLGHSLSISWNINFDEETYHFE